MLSRRLLRIKVMQQVYALELNAHQTTAALLTALERNVSGAYKVYLANLYTLLKVSQYSIQYEEDQKRKLLNRGEIPNYSILASFPLIKNLEDDKIFQSEIEHYKINQLLDNDIFKSIFIKLKSKSFYNSIFEQNEPDLDEKKRVLKNLFKKVMLSSERFAGAIEDEFASWQDDKIAVINGIIGLINECKDEKNPNFQKVEMAECQDFARKLMLQILNEGSYLQQLVKPKLENWEIERVNVLDLVLIKMALCELIFFPNIPVKVSINEYIEISKTYSTPKSRDFINGILDALMNELKATGKIKKQGRGLLDN